MSVYKRNNDVSLLHPTFRIAISKVIDVLTSESMPFRIFEGFRYPERQAELFSQGRTKPGNIVTHAEPWRSYHQFGLAADLVLYIDGKWSWSTEKAYKPMWKRMHELGKKYGLSALDFELPHLQLSGTSSNALNQGVYPSGGDDDWAENLEAVILGWKGSPSAPPTPQVPTRPSI